MTDIVWKTTRLPDAIVGASYEASLSFTGNATAISAGSATGLPSSGNLAVNVGDHVRITGTPTKADLGTYTVAVTLTDTAGGVTSGNFTLVVRFASDSDRTSLAATSNLVAADLARITF
jgi:hypothetical protein